jgi:hypothetical protein
MKIGFPPCRDLSVRPELRDICGCPPVHVHR